jgi:hypothetical protein
VWTLVLHRLALLVGHQERVGGHRLVLLGRRMLAVGRLLGDWVRRVVHSLWWHLARWLTVERASMLVVLR